MVDIDSAGSRERALSAGDGAEDAGAVIGLHSGGGWNKSFGDGFRRGDIGAGGGTTMSVNLELHIVAGCLIVGFGAFDVGGLSDCANEFKTEEVRGGGFRLPLDETAGASSGVSESPKFSIPSSSASRALPGK